MPSPINPRYSADKYLYQISIPISNNIKFIHPNMITVINFGISFYIIYLSFYNLIWYSNFVYTLILLLLRSFLDILDGAHARNTKQYSEVGAFLDSLNDILFIIINCFLYAFKIPIKYILIKIIFYLSSLTLVCRLLYLLNQNKYDLLSDIPLFFIKITHTIHDNTIIFTPLLFLSIDYLIFNLLS